MIFKDGPLEIRDAIPADIDSMQDRMLDCEVVEIRELLGLEPRQALQRALELSAVASTVLYDGVPVLIFGLVADGTEHAANGWMLVSKDIEKMRFTFMKKSRLVIDDMLRRYSVIYNHINVKHEKVLRWLKWCGATIADPQLHEETGERYSLFILERSNHV